LIECLIVNPILLAADPGSAGRFDPSFIFMLAPLFGIWYFLVLRPQSQQRKKLQEMLGSLKTGDRVVTTGGIYGTIMGFKDATVQLQIASQVKVDVARSAITGVATEEAEDTSKQDSGSKGKK